MRLSRPLIGFAATVSLVGALTAPVAASDLPQLDPDRVAAAISGLPNDDMTGALLKVRGSAGRWSGTGGVARLGRDRPVRADGMFRIGSVTKAFTAVIALQLADEGRLALDRPVQHYLPKLLPRKYPTITVRQVLDHTSGLAYATPDTPETASWYVRHRFESTSPREMIASSTQHPMVHEPGAQQRYNGVNYFIAGLLIEKVTDHSYARELRTRITRPLRLEHTYLPVFNNPLIRGPHAHGYVRVGKRFVDVRMQSPYAWAEGGMVSTADDLTRFLRKLFRGRLLSPRMQRTMFTVPEVPYTGDDGNCQIGPDAGRACYSIGLTKTALPNGVTLWGKSGAVHGYTTAAFATRDLRRVMVYNLNPTGNHDGSEAPYVRKIVSAVFAPDLEKR